MLLVHLGEAKKKEEAAFELQNETLQLQKFGF